MEVVSRKAARARGLKRFFTGKPCLRGHYSERYLRGQCIRCSLEDRAKWRAEHPEKMKEENRLYREQHPDRMKKSCRNWRKKNLEDLKVKIAKWSKENRPARCATYQNRKARKKGNGGKHTGNDIQDLRNLQRNKCACCNIDFSVIKYHVDHIIPIARGGSNDRRNLQLLCKTCNMRKHSRDPIEFMRAEGKLL